jgi:lipopolysaccharide transport system permease protein
MIRNLRELYQYRRLLFSLVQRELKARYRASLLGFFWTFLNPTLHMLVYAIVFGRLLKQAVDKYPYFMFVGLLPWIWFSASVAGGASAISDRRDLLTKVRFPPQVLPAQVVATHLVNYLFSLPLLVILGLLYKSWPTWHVLLFPLVVIIQLLFTLGLTYLVAAVNVTFRDVQHIVGNILMLSFFLTPVLYSLERIPIEYRAWVELGNPMAVLIGAYQDLFYEHRLPRFGPLVYVFGFSLVLLWLTSLLFERRREEFAELI